MLSVNAHATDAFAARRRNMPIPDADGFLDRRLPADYLFRASLPPIKRKEFLSRQRGANTRRREQLGAADDEPLDGPDNDPAQPLAPLSLTEWPAQARNTFDGNTIVTAGSCLTTRDGETVAGWGFSAALNGVESLYDAAGPVVSSSFGSLYVGASYPSNNTGELSAMLFAFRWVAGIALPTVTLDYDSNWAADLVQRRSRPRCHFRLVLEARRAFDAATSRTIIVWRKIAAHTGSQLNERADVLAKCGATYLEPRQRPSGLILNHSPDEGV